MSYSPLSDHPHLAQTVYDVGVLEAPPTAPQSGEAFADVVIVGAGFTGLSAALHLAETGANVIVLEANEIGWGASGRNFGQVVPYLRHEPAHAIRRFGSHYGERLIQAAAIAPALVYDLIGRHRIACQERRNGLLFAAHTFHFLKGLERRQAYWAKKGIALNLLDRQQAKDLIGGGSYLGALLDPRGGTLNALSFARGLAACAIKAGARIFTRSAATGLTQVGGTWHVSTRQGLIRARSVILATNAYSDRLWPGLAASIVPMRIHQLASQPIAESLRRTILPGGHALTDTRRMASGVRLHDSGRLHVSADGPYFTASEQADCDGAQQRLLALFPQIKSLEWEYSWSGWIAVTPDEYPRLHQLAPSLFAALGYSGRGIGLATVLGREIAQHISGKPRDSLCLPLTTPRRIGFAPVSQIAVKTVVAFKRLRDRLDQHRLDRSG